MRIISLNANGIRAAERKGFFLWVAEQNADVICIQETKAQTSQLSADAFWPKDYHCFYHDAEKKGYSGVALYCRQKPELKRLVFISPLRVCKRTTPASQISLHGAYDAQNGRIQIQRARPYYLR